MMTHRIPDRDPDMMIVRALAPDAITPDLTARLRALADDLDRIAAGEAPTAADLAPAPLLVDWRFMLTWAGVSLAGFVAGHPLRGSRHIATSPLWVLDPDLGWARTLSRFYKLGLPAGGAVPRGNLPESGEPQP